MSKVTLDLGVEEIKNIIMQLPAQELINLMDALEERAETIAMMKLAETGFDEWNKQGEGIYDAEVKTR